MGGGQRGAVDSYIEGNKQGARGVEAFHYC